MKLTCAEAGNRGSRVRSDCWVRMTPKNSGGIKINQKSKVQILFGESNHRLILEILDFFGIKNAIVDVEDSGALPFVLMARLETVIRLLNLDNRKRFIPEQKYEQSPGSRGRFRRSRLYLPGDQPKLFLNAAIHKPDGLILDLEDSVSPNNKFSARILVRNALHSIDFMGAEKQVRINQLPRGLEDLEEIVPQAPDLILIPKVESPDQIEEIDRKVDQLLGKSKGDLFYMPIIESALGIMNAFSIAGSSPRIVALAIGLEDYTADIGTQRTQEGRESFFARSMIVNAARAAGIQAIDTVYSDVSDMDGLRDSVLEAKSLGFDGKGCIHPRQIAVIHRALSPSDEEIKKGKKIVRAFDEAQKKNMGVVSLGNKMIDPPVVKRAQNTISLAIREGLISQDWRNEDDSE